MADVADERSFHPRLTNLGTCEFTFALSLPRFAEPAVEDVQAAREPEITNPLLDRLAEILGQTSVAYLCVLHFIHTPRYSPTKTQIRYANNRRPQGSKSHRSLPLTFTSLRRSSTLPLAKRPPQGSALRDALIKRSPDVFHVTADRPSHKANPPRQLPQPPGTAGVVTDQTVSVATVKAPRVVRAGNASRHVELPAGPSSSELLEQFHQTCEDIFEKVDVSSNVRGGQILYEDKEMLTRDELGDLQRETTELARLGVMGAVPSVQITRLLDVLEKQAARADATEVREDDDENGVPGVLNILKALDAVSVTLTILCAKDMPKEVYREESIDAIVGFVKFQLTRNVFVFHDASYYQIHRGERETFDPDTAGGDENNTPVKKGKKGSSSRSAGTPGKRGKGSTGGAGGKTRVDQIPRAVKRINDLLSGVLTQLAHLLFTIHLPDATVLQLTSLAVSALTVDGVDLTQAKAVDVVVAAFKQYPEHRSLILDNLLLSLLKLPSSGRNLRRYMLPEDDSNSIQVLSAMLLKCVQASVTFEEPVASAALVVATSEKNTLEGYGPAFQWSHYFWKELLRGWQSARAQEIDIKSLMQNLVHDLLTTLNMPEWPVAGLMLLSLCAQLLSGHGISSNEIRVRELSLDFLGQVTARIKEDALLCEKDTTWSALFSGDEETEEGEDEQLCESDTRAAFELAQQDAADSRASHADANTQVADVGATDALVLEALLLRHVFQNEVRHETPGRADRSAFTFVLAQLSREAERVGVGFRSGGVGPGGTKVTYESLAKVLHAHVDSKFVDSVDGAGSLPRPAAVRLCRQLQQRLPLARQAHILVDRLLGALEDPTIMVRAAAVRALASVVDSDPSLLSWPEVHKAVHRRMSDNGTAVRSAVVDLLGKHVVNDPSIAETYYGAIVERIADVGVSVRKRVINILFDCLKSGPDFAHSIQALRHLAFRVLDDDPGVQELVVKIFRELWFSKPPVRKRNANKEGTDDQPDPITERAEQLVAVTWEVYCGVSRVGYAKLPLLPSFPIVAVLRKVVFPSEEEQTALRGSDETRSGEFSETVTTARAICGAILDGMLAREEAADELDDGDAGGDTAGNANGSDMTRFPRAVRYALGLHVFCATDARLCVADENPLHFATSLQPYVKRNENTSANSLQLQCCISVVDAVVKECGCLSRDTAVEIEKDLRFLLLRNTFHGVLYYASRCICSVAETLAANAEHNVASGALQICRRFVKLLDEVSEKETLSVGERAHVSRALFVLGHLARFGADTLEFSREQAVSPSNLLRVFRVFLQRTVSANEFDLKRGALQACGFMFVTRPQLMLCPKGGFGKGSMDGIMRAALGPSAEKNLKEQALLNLDEYLREEEVRTMIMMSDDANAQGGGSGGTNSKAAAATIAGTGGALSRAKRRRLAEAKRAEANNGLSSPKKDAGFQTVNGEHDNSLANGVAQRYWNFVIELCVDPEPAVRLKALHLAEVVLRQGLVHPMSCFPPLIALQADPLLTSKKLAMRLLRQQHGKYPDFFDHQLGAGLGLLFEFCKRLQAAARRAARKGGQRVDAQVASAEVVNDGFTNIYKLVNGTRSTRFKFLSALLRRYEGKTVGSDVTYLCFLANAIAALPFTMTDEVLFVIFHLNRIISLRASTLQDSLTERVAAVTAKNDEELSADLKDDVELSLSASIMLSLKQHLKLTFDITDAKTQAYNPAEPLKSGEAFRKDEEASSLDLSWCDPLASATLASCAAQAELFATLMVSDANDYGEYAAARKRGRPKKKRKKFAVDDDDTEEEEDDESDDDEPFSPALPKTATLASPKSARKGKRRKGNDSNTPTPRKKLAL